jgi:hypothetical protein
MKIKKHKLEIKEKYDSSFMFIAITTIQEQHKKDNKWEGITECPKCNNDLHYTIAPSNKHIWGMCKTKNCLKWIM